MNLSEVPIRADNFKIIDRGSLLAFFTVVLGAIRIHSCGVFQRPDGTVWVSLPRREWTDPDGNRHFFPLVELPRNLRQRIEETVQEAWSEIAGQPASTGTPESEPARARKDNRSSRRVPGGREGEHNFKRGDVT